MKTSKKTYRLFAWPLLVIACLLFFAALTVPALERHFLIQSGRDSKATLNIAVAGLRGALQRFQHLPSLIAERPELTALLRTPDDPVFQARVNANLLATTSEVGASDLFLMDADALTIAASSYRKEKSFIGQNFAFRPYFREAIKGGAGRYFALGTTSGERGYFFSSPIRDGDEILGVLALKFTVDDFEEVWRGGAYTVIVTDRNDIVFMSSRPDWLFNSLSEIGDATLASIAADRQYPIDRISYLKNRRAALDDALLTFTFADQAGDALFVSASASLEEAGWRVWTLTPAEPSRRQALVTYTVIALSITLGGALVALLRIWRLRLRDRLEAQRATQTLLKRRVAERTNALTAANRQLRAEVEERKATETLLRETQDELVQAGKLAGLGQMAAAISHEINQPLAVVKSNAVNAHALIERDQVEAAQGNITRISKMVDRIAGIIGHLRNFARDERGQVGAVNIVAVIDEALELLAHRIKSSAAVLDYARPTEDIYVSGGRLRLQQVLVNLVGNALDAVEASERQRVDVRITQSAAGAVRVIVADTGCGMKAEAAGRVFDPFFTTKPPGKGLGLGLSISYNIVRDFGGALTAANRSDGGAEFVLELRAAPKPAMKPVGEMAT